MASRDVPLVVESSDLSDSEDYYSSDCDSDIDDLFTFEERQQLGVQPYMFEPLLCDDKNKGGDDSDSDSDSETDSESDMSDDHADDDQQNNDRLGNKDWCKCGACQPMNTVEESICCQEIKQVKKRMDEVSLNLECMVKHPGFENVCLDKWVLDVAFSGYSQQYGDQGLGGTGNKMYRHMAYRQLALYSWKYLGKRVRVRLPACAVLRIRQKYPSEDNKYKGLNEV